jgi:adenine phosphoribosyltransferase
VLLVDDVLATGGTVAATTQLIERCGGVPHAVTVLMELGFLDGRARTGDVPIASVVTI